MMPRAFPILAIAATALLCSCKDDPELVKKNDALEVEIQVLEQKLIEAQERMKHQPKDVSGELLDSKRLLQQMEVEASKLEAELISLRDEKMSLEQRFAEYRKKYPIR